MKFYIHIKESKELMELILKNLDFIGLQYQSYSKGFKIEVDKDELNYVCLTINYWFNIIDSGKRFESYKIINQSEVISREDVLHIYETTKNNY